MDKKNIKENNIQFFIHKIYLKDISFESPYASDIFFNENIKPKTDIQINSNFSKIKENVYETVLKITITAKFQNKILFLIEVHQAGIFKISNINKEEKKHLLEVYCPSILFPYAKELIVIKIIKGGFPEIHIPPINFEALYQKKINS